MNKKNYQKPTMDVVELEQQTSMLTGSNEVTATMKGTFTEEDWSDGGQTSKKNNYLEDYLKN